MTAPTIKAVEERRDCSFAAAGIEIRAADDGVQVFEGHASVFEQRTEIGNPRSWFGWYEEIATGAFDETLKTCDARMLVDHDSSLLVSRQSAGDLRLSVDDIGLATESDLDTEVSYIRDLARNVQARRITGMSFGFYVRKDVWTTETEVVDGKEFIVEVRRIEEVELIEVSAVTFPAFPTTDANVRSMLTEIRAARGVPPRIPTNFRATDGLEADLIAARYGLA